MSPHPSDDPSDFYLPPELLLCIFSFCSPSTLACLTRTNFTLLELASSFLYRSVHLEGAEQLRLFFGSLDDDEEKVVDGVVSGFDALRITCPSPSRLTPFLSLSQTHHLSFKALTYLDGLSPLSRRRLPPSPSPSSSSSTSNPLPLQTLLFSLPPQPPFTEAQLDAFPPPPPSRLLTLVAPRCFHFKGRHDANPLPSPSSMNGLRPLAPPPPIPHLPYLDISLFPWSTLQKATITDAQILWTKVLVSPSPSPSTPSTNVLPKGFELVVDLAGSWRSWEEGMIRDLVLDACEVLVVGEEGRGGGAKVKVLVESKARKTVFQRRMVELVLVGGGPEVNLERVKKVLRCEVVGGEKGKEGVERGELE